ncbi:MAG: hypothetical protein KY468_12805 [Armatimonadetes bacterium]|nr:hypothetical protein [Armatimonadota bacterium]
MNFYRRIAVIAVLGLLMGVAAPPARATTVENLTLEEITRRADTVFIGKVLHRSSAWDPERKRIWTTVTFQVLEGLAGKSQPKTVTRRFLGGKVGGIAMRVGEMPQFEVGEKVALFAYEKPNLYCPLVGWDQGKYIIEKDPAGQEVVLNSRRRPVNLLAPGSVRSLSVSARPTTLQQFTTRIKQLRARSG